MGAAYEGGRIDYRGVVIPRVSFGAVSSDDLFGEKEQALFDFYERSRDRYRCAVDIGANVGVHSILMARQGWWVFAYEPDPAHYVLAVENFERNGVKVDLRCAAVSGKDGEAEFVRVLGNTTGSHLSGLKDPYGELQRFTVKVVDAAHLFHEMDFCKVDAEGAEADIVERLEADGPDLMIEVGSEANAVRILDHLRKIGRRSWAQKSGWGEVKYLADMPTHHSHGALFVAETAP